MKAPALALALIFSVASSFSQLRADSGVTLADFKNSGFTYGYEGWKDLGAIQKTTADAVHLSGPAAGGAGLILPKLQDITGSKTLAVKIKRSAETSGNLQIKLIDGANVSEEWTIKTSDIPTDKFGTIQLPLDPKAKLDLEEIKHLQVQGDFNPSGHVDLDLASIAAS